MSTMRVIIVISVLTCLESAGVLSRSIGENVTVKARPEMQPAIARACNRLALGVYGGISNEHDNIVLSPFSMCSILAVCFRSSRGKTLSELRRRLLLELSDKKEMSTIFGSIQKSFVSDPNITITSKNIMFVNKNLEIVEETAKDFRTSYNGTIEMFDPTENELISSRINDMVARNTNERVEGELKAEDINSDNGLILVNTVLLNARWKDMFDSEITYPLPFYLPNNTEINVPTMSRRGKYRWNSSKKLKIDVIEIPYEGDRFAMYIILPRDKNGLADLEKEFTPGKYLRLHKILSNMKKARSTELYLPKFSVNHSFSLKQALQRFNINLIFDKDQSDLSELIKGRNVFIQNAFHQSSIEVTEKGTEAGAYTLMIGQYYSVIPQFNANHPFMFVLRDMRTGFNVFMGKVSNP